VPGLFEDREQLGIGDDRRQLGRPRLVRKLQHEPRRKRVEREAPELARRGDHVPLEVVSPPAQAVESQAVLLAVRQQPDLVVFAARPEQLDRLLEGHDRPRDRRVLGHDLPHAGLDVTKLRLRERRPPAHLAEVPAGRRRRVLDAHLDVREDLGCRGDQEKGQ
jgi:hypothetical protein